MAAKHATAATASGVEHKPFHTVDERGFPRVWVHFRGLPKDDNEYDAFLADMSKLYARKTKFTILFDTNGLPGMLTLDHLGRLRNWLRANHDNAKAYLTDTAICTSSGTVRALMSVLFTLYKPASKVTICATMDEALQALQWHLHAPGK